MLNINTIGPRIREEVRSYAVILGLDSNGLATVRSLGNLGIPCIALEAEKNKYETYTRIGIKVHCPNLRNENLIDDLLKLGEQFKCKAVLFPSNDDTLLTTSELREVLEPYFHLFYPGKAAVRMILNKSEFYRKANEISLTIPRTVFPENLQDIRSIGGNLRPPYLIKPFDRNKNWREKFGDIKAISVSRPEDLPERFDAVYKVHHDLLVQENIPGPDSNLLFSLVYSDREGDVIGMFTGRKIRQWPIHHGTSTLTESLDLPKIASDTAETLKKIGYWGYASIEYKRDPRDLSYRILEITGRTWFPHGIATAAGVNLPMIAYYHLVEGRKFRPRKIRRNFYWIHELNDLKSSYAYLRKKEWTLLEILTSYLRIRAFSTLSLRDPLPSVILALQLIKKSLKRITGMFF